MILLIDNYDSFSYNLYQLIGAAVMETKVCSEEEAEAEITVIRNDRYPVEELEALSPEAIFISPGPGRPEDAGVCVEMIQKLAGKIPMFGVCLGHQAICHAFGGTVTYAKELMHGKKSDLMLTDDSLLFEGLSSGLQVARYHSLSATEETLPSELRITAKTADGEVMAVEHSAYPVYGVQFHPESVMTPDGIVIVRNFLNSISKKQ